jgi:uncharacterized protein YqjF (DUF2071 family)
MPIDRLGPSRRESCQTRRVGRQTWLELLFVHYEVPAEAIARLLPPGLSVDLFEGKAYVGLVPFQMRDVHIGPFPMSSFLETNLRTYVVAGGVPGVWFLSLDAESSLAVWGGRTFYQLPYFESQMSHAKQGSGWRYELSRLEEPAAALEVEWSWADSSPHAPEEGTLAHFLTERFALYGRASSKSEELFRVRVHHPTWPLRRATLGKLDTTIPQAMGLIVGDPIDLVLCSEEGVSVEVFGREPIAAVP